MMLPSLKHVIGLEVFWVESNNQLFYINIINAFMTLIEQLKMVKGHIYE